MAYNVSYKGLNDKNIKNIYSDRKLKFMFPRHYTYRLLKEDLPLPPLKRYPKRFYEYYPAYNIGIPRAPAFRGTDQEHMDKIVQRVSKPIACQHARRLDLVRESQEEEEEEEKNEEERKREAEERRERKAEIAALTARLQKHTESSKQKVYDKEQPVARGNKDFCFQPLPPLPPING